MTDAYKVIAFVIAVGIVVVGTIWDGFVLSVLWRWFAVPFGLPVLTLAQAIGVAILTSMLAHQYVPVPEDHVKERLAYALFAPLVLLAMGWVVKQWL